MKKNLDFKEVYKLPLYFKEFAPFMVLTADDQRAFDFEWQAWPSYEKGLEIDDKSIHDIIAKLNGDSNVIIENYYNFTYKDGEIWAFSTKAKKKKKVMLIRGWGHLTGTGGLHLSESAATKIQDDFGQYIINILNDANYGNE